MEPTATPKPHLPWDRWITVGTIGLAALLASGWMMRERQWATDRAESREDMRQAMHRLKTLSSSADQIRTAYLQRKSELDATRKKLEQANARSSEDRGKPPATPDERAKSAKTISAFAEKLSSSKLPAWAATEKADGAIRILPGISLPKGNVGFQNFASLASTFVSIDPDWTLELIARAEPASDAWETAQERADLLIRSAEKSLQGQPARLRVRLEVTKGPRMEWRLQPPEITAQAPPEPKPASPTKAEKK